MDKEKLTGLQILNQLHLSEKEEETMMCFFAKMKIAENTIEQYSLSDYQPMVHNIDLTNILRDDIQRKNYSREELQKEAPQETDGYWQVPRLVE